MTLGQFLVQQAVETIVGAVRAGVSVAAIVIAIRLALQGFSLRDLK